MAQITYTDKVTMNENPDIPAINKVQAADMNEIKNVVNENDDIVGDISGLNTTDKSSVVNAINEVQAGVNDSGWIDLTLQGGATPRSNDFAYKPQIRKIGKTVFLKGQVTVPAHSSALVIAVIPEDYRAGYEIPMKAFTADCWISGGGNVTVKVDNTRREAQSLNNSWLIN